MTCLGVVVAAHSQQKQHAHNVIPSGVASALTGQAVLVGNATGRVMDSTIAASFWMVTASFWMHRRSGGSAVQPAGKSTSVLNGVIAVLHGLLASLHQC